MENRKLTSIQVTNTAWRPLSTESKIRDRIDFMNEMETQKNRAKTLNRHTKQNRSLERTALTDDDQIIEYRKSGDDIILLKRKLKTPTRCAWMRDQEEA